MTESYTGGNIVLHERNHEFCWRCLECSLREDSTEFSKKIRAGNINLGITGIRVAFKALVLTQLTSKRSKELNNQIWDRTLRTNIGERKVSKENQEQISR